MNEHSHQEPDSALPSSRASFPLLLSTMWAQQRRFQGDMTTFACIARAAGYDGIEISHSTRADGLEELLRGESLPVRSLHAPAPHEPTRYGPYNAALNLAATDEEERALALEHTVRTIRYAGDCGARTVVLHLGGVGKTLFPEESTLRRLFHAGQMAGEEAQRARAAAHRRRAEQAPAYLDAAQRALAALVEVATPLGVTLGLENRLHFHEIPSPEETVQLLADYAPDQAGYWHDVGHAEVQHRLGLLDARAALATLAPRLVGVHLHDVRGIVDHRAPSNGDVDWTYVAAAVRPDTVRTCEIDQREPEALLAYAVTFLRGWGIVS